MCTVVNIKHYGSKEKLTEAFGDKWVYIGRSNPTYRVGKSVLANPYKLAADQDPGETLEYYRHWLWHQIQAEHQGVIKALLEIKDDTVLVCWCKPGPCHGDIVRDAARWLQSQDVIKSSYTRRRKNGSVAIHEAYLLPLPKVS
jgi:hypothetical protein